MKENKDKNQYKEHDVETPPPPQTMDPSKLPQKDESKNEKGTDNKKDPNKDSAARSKKGKDRKLAPNEEL